MFQRPKYLMNEQDGSPGGGAVPNTPAQPTAPNGAAEPAATAPQIPADVLKSALGEVLAGVLPELRNGIFADLRKAGVFKPEKPTAPESPPATTAAQSASMSPSDVKTMLAYDRAITRAEVEHKLTDRQSTRMRAALEVDKPDDVGAWAASYLTDMGLMKSAATVAPATPLQPATPPAPAAPTAPVASKPNISDKGPAAPSDARDSEAIYDNRPLDATHHDFERLVLKKGNREQALQFAADRINAYLRTVKLVPDNRRQR